MIVRINGVDIQSVAFGQGQVEITYAEERDIESPSGIIEMRTLVAPLEVVEEAATEALDSIQQLLESALVAKRNPSAVIRR